MTTSTSGALGDFSLHIDDRTRVRPLQLTDAQELFELCTRNREHLEPWFAWIDGVRDVTDTFDYLRTCQDDARAHRAFRAAIVQDDAIVGSLDVHDIDWINRVGSIGYWLDAAQTGRGVMTSSVRAMIDYAFTGLDLHRIEIRATTQNHASRRVAERLGFTQEGVLRSAHRMREEYHDVVLYAALRDEWEPSG